MKITINTKNYLIGDSIEYHQKSIMYKNIGKFNSITEILVHDKTTQSVKKGIILNSGITTITNKQYITKEDKLYIIVGTSVFLITLPNLELISMDTPDPSAIFGIYIRNNLVFTHCEQNLTCYDLNLNKKWSFVGRDIFANPKKSDILLFLPKQIQIIDFNSQKYTLDYYGNLIS